VDPLRCAPSARTRLRSLPSHVHSRGSRPLCYVDHVAPPAHEPGALPLLTIVATHPAATLHYGQEPPAGHIPRNRTAT